MNQNLLFKLNSVEEKVILTKMLYALGFTYNNNNLQERIKEIESMGKQEIDHYPFLTLEFPRSMVCYAKTYIDRDKYLNCNTIGEFIQHAINYTNRSIEVEINDGRKAIVTRKNIVIEGITLNHASIEKIYKASKEIKSQ